MTVALVVANSGGSMGYQRGTKGRTQWTLWSRNGRYGFATSLIALIARHSVHCVLLFAENVSVAKELGEFFREKFVSNSLTDAT